MRILVLAPQPFMTQRGTPIAVRMMLETLSARGDRVDLLTFPEGEDVEIEGCRIHRVPALPGLRGFAPGFSLRKLAADAVMLPMAGWRMARTRYDLVIGVEEAAFMAMALRPLFGVPFLADVDSSMPEQIDDKVGLPPWLRRLLDRAEGAMLRRAAGAVTCCRALQEIVESHAPEVPVRTVEDVTMLGEDRSVPEDCRFADPVVMYVGNLEGYQGVDLLIDAMARLDPATHPARLVVIGGGAAHVAAAKRRVEELGIGGRAHFLGPRPVEQLGRYLAAATITASPRTQGRNTPMKIYSYLDSGRPLLATRLPTHTQVLDDAIAILADPEPEAMAAALERLLEDAALRERLGAAAQARVAAEFSPAAYRRKLDGFLSDVIEPRLGRGAAPVAADAG
ncbi:glycosyltransferase family 4 protein [Jannaschia sp. W003]|uniref:glycosyltransferase family 4 protein n=1 Tax=Jannaschia sp. W003 TaxID=2867012 RepID=UPI0021A8EAE4|nr:glycosyltransferase family 4 protein [Jannaschia sp. W003]UWQ21574.1 glycosyltransferase family 4 protein [Jannaschia sp. W003]